MLFARQNLVAALECHWAVEMSLVRRSALFAVCCLDAPCATEEALCEAAECYIFRQGIIAHLLLFLVEVCNELLIR